MANKKIIEDLRASYKDLPDADLIIIMGEFVSYSERHLAAKIELDSRGRKSELETRESEITMHTTSVWNYIKADYDISKKSFGRKINFIKDVHIRKIIFRDIEHAYLLSRNGFAKPAVILAGGVIEELLRQFLKSKHVTPKEKTFNGYIKACEDNRLLRTGISKLSDSARDFRNLVHLAKEKSARFTLSKPAAKGAVSSIFIIADDF